MQRNITMYLKSGKKYKKYFYISRVSKFNEVSGYKHFKANGERAIQKLISDQF